MPEKPAHHPPDPGAYERPWTDKARPIFGSNAIAGYGDRWFYVAAVARSIACDVIRRHHYSGRIVQNSYVHLGVHIDGNLCGILQLGYALNPASLGKVVAGTGTRDYLELNRMWLDDAAPRNSESRAIAYAIRYLRAAMPQVRFIQTFADERCGGLGVVYQAANFLFVGSHVTSFYELDGEWFHKMLLTAHRKGGQRGIHLRANVHRATEHRLRQFRYIYFLHRSVRRHLRLPVLPYPKRDELRSVNGDNPETIRAGGSIPYDRSIIEEKD